MSDKVFKLDTKIDTIITDIEGTTTSISFVKDCLFPYIRANLKDYLHKNFDNQETIDDIALLRAQAVEDTKTNNNVPLIRDQSEHKDALIDSVVSNVTWQMDVDRKAKPLKQLQGHMWSHAYKNGLIKGHIYDDVVPGFDRWIQKTGLKLYIYSSGSIQAQKLLFGYSEKGDLNKYFSGNFDTTIGFKVESASYQNILNEIGKAPNQCLFLTDLIREAEAAESIGMRVFLLRRPDNPDKEIKNFDSITNFNQIE